MMASTPKFTLLHRVLHWTMAFAMPVLFITGFLRMYWMNKHRIAEIVTTKAAEVSQDVASQIGGAVRSPMWHWHEKFAYVMIIAFVVRILYMLIKGVRFPNPFKRHQSRRVRLQGLTYVYFYLFVAIQAFTGICMEKGLLQSLHEPLESIHKWAVYGFPLFIFLHLLGIVVAEHGDKKGITSKMIGGD